MEKVNGASWRSTFGGSWRAATLFLSLLGTMLLPLAYGLCLQVGGLRMNSSAPVAEGVGSELLCDANLRLWFTGELEGWGSDVMSVELNKSILAALVTGGTGVILVTASVLVGASNGGGPRRCFLRVSVSLRVFLFLASAVLSGYEGWMGGSLSVTKGAVKAERWVDTMPSQVETGYRVLGWLLASALFYMALVTTLTESWAFCLDGASEDMDVQSNFVSDPPDISHRHRSRPSRRRRSNSPQLPPTPVVPSYLPRDEVSPHRNLQPTLKSKPTQMKPSYPSSRLSRPNYSAPQLTQSPYPTDSRTSSLENFPPPPSNLPHRYTNSYSAGPSHHGEREAVQRSFF